MPQQWPLSLELLRWTPWDKWRLEQAVEGVLITGATGSGKTTGPFNYVARSLLRCGCGGLFLCAKKDAATNYRALAEQEGRQGDVITFSLEEGHCFNFLTYEATRYGAGKAIIENVVRLLMQAHEVTNRTGGGQGMDFFDNSMRQLLRNCLEVVITATGKVDLFTVAEIVATLPQSPIDEDAEKHIHLASLKFLRQAERNQERCGDDIRLARKFFTKDWPHLADRTRSSIAQTLSVLLDSLMRYPLHQLLGSETTCSPDDVLGGKVILVDVPVKEFDHIGKIVGTLWKFSLQRAIESRIPQDQQTPDTVRPVFIAADECQFWTTAHDALFQTTARAARGITLYATQNLPNFYAEVGGDATSRARIDSLIGNLTTRLGCQNGEPQTNQWYAESVGKVRKLYESRSYKPFSGLPQSSSTSEHLDFDLQPRVFTTLKTGGEVNRFVVEAVLTSKGRKFRTGNRWLRVSFHQKHPPSWWKQWFSSKPLVRITAPVSTLPERRTHDVGLAMETN